MPKKPLEILVFGAGAVGSVLGWRLAQNPHVRVTAVCRSTYETVKRQGFQMHSSIWGPGVFRPHRVIRNTSEVAHIPFNFVVCTNKITEPAESIFIENIRPVVRPETTLVPTQNGFSVEPLLQRHFQENTILSSVCYISCVQHTPGVIHQIAQIRPYAFSIGVYQDLKSTNQPQQPQPVLPSSSNTPLDTLLALSDRSTLHQTPNITSERWTKLIFNGSWNPTATLFRLNSHEIYAQPAALTLVRALAQEIYEVALASGIPLSPSTPYDTTECARAEPPIILSMLQDLRRGRDLEIEALCGSILRRAKLLNVPVPAIEETYGRLMALAMKKPVRAQVFGKVTEAHPPVAPVPAWGLAMGV